LASGINDIASISTNAPFGNAGTSILTFYEEDMWISEDEWCEGWKVMDGYQR
jgi:hypothetical protein